MMMAVSDLFPLVLFPMYGLGDIVLLDLHFSYTPDMVDAYLSALGTEGRSAYITMALTSDLVFPVCYSLTLSIALVVMLRKLHITAGKLRYLSLFPFLIVISDWVENLSLAVITRAFPQRLDALVKFASFSTSLKWVLVISAFMLLLGLLSYWGSQSRCCR